MWKNVKNVRFGVAGVLAWSRGSGRLALAGVALALAGCASGDIVLDRPGADYVRDVSARVAAVEWSLAETVTVDLSEHRFEPANLVLDEGVGYRLILRNTGDRRHTFVSEDFFKSIAVHKLISAAGVIERPSLKVIEVLPGESKELHLVAVRPGVYDLKCSVFLHESFGMHGQITVR